MSSLGTWAVAVGGVFLVLGLLVTGPVTSCTDVTHRKERPGGYAYTGTEGGAIYFTPDGGVNECAVPVTLSLVPLGGAVATAGVVLGWRRGRT